MWKLREFGARSSPWKGLCPFLLGPQVPIKDRVLSTGGPGVARQGEQDCAHILLFGKDDFTSLRGEIMWIINASFCLIHNDFVL